MGNNGHGREKEILELIPKENSWEQIIYKVVAMNDLDPWNLDLNVLSKGFADHIMSIEEIDFRVPAKWVIIAAVLLRMKSDYIKIMKMDREPEEDFMDFEDMEDTEMEEIDVDIHADDVDPIDAAPRRKPVRRVTVTELVDSLRRVLSSERRRELRVKKARGKISIRTDDIAVRIEKLYSRISDMLNGMKDNKVTFSSLVDKWERDKIIDQFMPLMHLDNQKKIECTQREIFDEILIKKKPAS